MDSSAAQQYRGRPFQLEWEACEEPKPPREEEVWLELEEPPEWPEPPHQDEPPARPELLVLEPPLTFVLVRLQELEGAPNQPHPPLRR